MASAHDEYAHAGAEALMKLPASGSLPRSANRAMIAGSARTALIYEARVRSSQDFRWPGQTQRRSAFERVVVVTASARSLPDWICGSAEVMASNMICTSPAISPACAGTAPL